MPIHDWTRVSAGTFHDMHIGWIAELRRALNSGLPPGEYYAQAEQVAANVAPDVLTLRAPGEPGANSPIYVPETGDLGTGGGLALMTTKPATRVTGSVAEPAFLASRRRRIVIRHATGDDAVALIEIVSPGNKSGRAAVGQFVDKAVAALQQGLHLQVIDLFPPSRFDPAGLHGSIWEEMGGTYEPPLDRPLTAAAYAALATGADCYVEPSAVGLPLADLPLFLTADQYVNVPLEATYMAAYESVPRRWRQVIEG